MGKLIIYHETKLPESIAEFKDKAIHPIASLLLSYCAITEDCGIGLNKFDELKDFKKILNSDSDDPFFNIDTFKHIFMKYIKEFNLPLDKIKNVYVKYDIDNETGYLLFKFTETINYNGKNVEEVMIKDVFV